MFDIDDLIDDLNDESEFEEIPVDIDTFMGKGYLEQTGVTLSHYQKEMIEHMTQIFRYDTLLWLYGKDEADRLLSKTVREIICMLGKGSGKDYIAEVACAYVVYKLLCMKDPARYFGKPPGDSIDIINVAINADQAQNVFFKGFARMIKNSPWFQGKFVPRQRSFSFDKNISVYSGHSEAEAFEGYNTLMVILDEIAGFDHIPKGDSEEEVTPAQAIYNMYDASLTSRFGDAGKLVLLSFPRGKGDFISARYDEVAVDITSYPQEHTFVLNPELSPDEPGNSFTIEWTIDEIHGYKESGIWALRRPSWDVNPTKHIDMYIRDFFRNPALALGKFAAEPQESTGGFFDDHESINEFSNFGNGVDDNNAFHEWFKQEGDHQYFIHVDLARKHDRCVVSMAHVSGWKRTSLQGADDIAPIVKVDLVRYWTPDRGKQIDFIEVREFVMSVIRRGFNVKRVTFDQWQSEEMIKYFNRAGVQSEILSVGLQHYMDLKLIIADKRGQAPRNDILRRELKQLFITKNGKNVDHPRTKNGSKDIADAVCGAVYNAANLTPKAMNHVYEVYSESDFREEEQARVNPLINPPKAAEGTRMPPEIERYLGLI